MNLEKNSQYLDNTEFWHLRHNSDLYDKQIDNNERSMVTDYDSLSSDDSLKNLFIKKEKENDAFIVNNANKINTKRIIDTIELINTVNDDIDCNNKLAKVEKIVSMADSKQIMNNVMDTLNDVTINGDDLSSSDESMPSNADDLLTKIAYNLKHLKDNIDEIDSSAVTGDLIDFSDDGGESGAHHSQVQCNEMDSHHKTNERLLCDPNVYRDNDTNNNGLNKTKTIYKMCNSMIYSNDFNETNTICSDVDIACMVERNEWPSTNENINDDDTSQCIGIHCKHSDRCNTTIHDKENNVFAFNIFHHHHHLVSDNRNNLKCACVSIDSHLTEKALHETQISAQYSINNQNACAETNTNTLNVTHIAHCANTLNHCVENSSIACVDNDDVAKKNVCIKLKSSYTSTPLTKFTDNGKIPPQLDADTDDDENKILDENKDIRNEQPIYQHQIVTTSKLNKIKKKNEKKKVIFSPTNVNDVNVIESFHIQPTSSEFNLRSAEENQVKIYKPYEKYLNEINFEKNENEQFNKINLNRTILLKSVKSKKKCLHSRRRCRCVIKLFDINNQKNQNFQKIANNKIQKRKNSRRNCDRKIQIDVNGNNGNNNSCLRPFSACVTTRERNISNRSNFENLFTTNELPLNDKNNILFNDKSILTNELLRVKISSIENLQTLSSSDLSLNTLSPNSGEHFEGSNRLRRLEQRFRDIANTKKLVHETPNVEENSEFQQQPQQTQQQQELNSLQADAVPTSDSNNNHIKSHSSTTECQNLFKLHIEAKHDTQNRPTEFVQTQSSNYENVCEKNQCLDDENFINPLNQQNNSNLVKSFGKTSTKSNDLCDKETKSLPLNRNINEEILLKADLNVLNTKSESNTPASSSSTASSLSIIDSNGILSYTYENLSSIDVTKNDKSTKINVKNILSESPSTESEEIQNLFPDQIEPVDNIDAILETSCAFDARNLNVYRSNQFGDIHECYDELENQSSDEDNSSDSAIEFAKIPPPLTLRSYQHHFNNEQIQPNNELIFSGKFCVCKLKAIIPSYHTKEVTDDQEFYEELEEEDEDVELTSEFSLTNNIKRNSCAIMRDMSAGGTLRGLLKKPNRPPPLQKNRVIFDETRNEFFDADYIILVRDDCPYDEEDEEPCTCGEHELVRLCCDEGCQCTAYADDARTPQSPKYAPPIEFVDQAALSPPEGYKDGGANLQQALGGALGGHIFGAQHIQQLQVIQRLQAQRAAMLAARASTHNHNQSQTNSHVKGTSTKSNTTNDAASDNANICTECSECSECAAKKEQEEESVTTDEPIPVLPHVALLSIQATSPERRFTQKEIIAGEERPKYLLMKQHQDAATDKKRLPKSKQLNQQSYVVETLTMTTVTERHLILDKTDTTNSIIESTTVTTAAAEVAASTATSAQPSTSSNDSANETATHGNDIGTDKLHSITDSGVSSGSNSSLRSTYPSSASEISLTKPNSISAQITGILKGGKLWKNEQIEESTSNVTSDDDSSKRSVRFIDASKSDIDTSIERDLCDGHEIPEDSSTESSVFKKHSALFHNALRPNSAVRQLFPTAVLHAVPQTTPLTHEALRAFDESKRTHLKTTVVHSDSETDNIRRTIERNALRRSLIKKKAQKPETSLEERIRQLTCDVDEPLSGNETNDDNKNDENNVNLLERRDSPAGEENPQQTKYTADKNFSPSSSISSSSSSSMSAYRKITDIFHKDKRQERIPEADENPIVIIPQDCRCPSAPDLGIGVHMPASHTQIHQTPPRSIDSRRQFLSTLAPLTSCVAGQHDDMSIYSRSAGDRNSTASSRCSEYSLGDIDAALQDETKKVAPDVIAGTPGQEQDELATFVQQEANRTERIKKRYSGEAAKAAMVTGSNIGSDDDEQNDYGFNSRPSVCGIKPRTNEILEEMQEHLASANTRRPSPHQITSRTTPNPIGQSNTLPKANAQQQQQLQIKNIPTPGPVLHAQPQQLAASVVQQNISTWNAYYQEQAQRNSLPVHATGNYYPTLPMHSARHSFQEDTTIYQNLNCQSVSMEQHYGQSFARSPTRRPESPPPLRNYHQTMVLIPYNAESYAHFATANDVNQPYRQHNIVEYQQVTQQTIRVPIGYPLPGMQLHVVTGNPVGQQYAQYATRQQITTSNPNSSRAIYGYAEKRGVPEGAASVTQSDCNALIPTSGTNQPITTTTTNTNNTQTADANNSSAQGAVFYAMNV